MNYVDHLDDIQDNLFKRNKFSGCYIYSRDQKDDTYKLGMSRASLFARVKQAKSCYPYPSEFWLHMFIICENKSSVIPLENKLLKAKMLKKNRSSGT